MKSKDPQEEQNKDAAPQDAAEPDTAGQNNPADVVENLEKALAEQKIKTDEYLAALQRNQADFSNYRRRTEQEKADLGKYANFKLFCDILPVLDDIELALNHIPAEYAKLDWVEGVRLVERKFRVILEKQGVKPVCALGMAFDPNLHEAIKQEKGAEGAVIAEVQKGYTMGDKLLRPSRVIVGNGEGAGETPPKAAEETHHKREKKKPEAEQAPEA
jgi:molecular chaperone GrpE